jgi:hypothetical protein
MSGFLRYIRAALRPNSAAPRTAEPVAQLVAAGLVAILVLRNSIGNMFNNAATQLNKAPANPYP